MYCNHAVRRLRPRKRSRLFPAQPQAALPAAAQTLLPPGLVAQLAAPLTDMAGVEKLLAQLHGARARGYF